MMRRALVRRACVFLVVVLGLGLQGACVRRDTAVEKQPVTTNLAAYWTCTVAFSSDGRGADANEAFAFVPWFESRVRERGVFEPLARDEGAEAEVTLRMVASQADGGVNLRVQVVDTKTKESLGELEATAPVDEHGDAGEGDSAESRRLVALHGAADQILEVLKTKRQASMAEASKARKSPPPPPLPDGPPVGASASCSTQCLAPAATSTSYDETHRVSAGMDPTMKELRGCLDRVGAQLIVPAVLLRFSPDGSLRHMRVDVGGYEQTECIQGIRSRMPRVWTSRASILRCEYRCTVS